MVSSSDDEALERNTEETPNQTNPIPPPEQETLENQNSDVVVLDQKTSDSSDKKGEEEEAECGFCLYMKAGGCKDSFVAWEECMEEAEENKEDVVEKCFQVTMSLKNCMEAHPDYYEPILKAEKAAEQQVTKGMQESKEIEIEIEIENEPESQNNKIEEAVKQTDPESVVVAEKEVVVAKEVELKNNSESVVVAEKEDEVELKDKVAEEEEEETKNPVMSFFDKVFSFKF
ncbi:hypothetical protein MKW94_015983 [Papaver nudicaule]|uniref:GCK domain-containing protein n=1 Tax=Papaver nudicaule TaxID=74823 RepID=A0AA41V3N2_PAPNU|nr:hypothetical protein [Papaver nudicaule]